MILASAYENIILRFCATTAVRIAVPAVLVGWREQVAYLGKSMDSLTGEQTQSSQRLLDFQSEFHRVVLYPIFTITFGNVIFCS